MEADLAKKTLFVIEDDEFLSQILARHLADEPFNLVTSMTAEEALKKIREEKPDLILLDLVLPGMDGYTFLKTVKADPQLQSIPVIIASNLGQQDEILKARKLGAENYFIKANMDLDEMTEEIKKALAENPNASA